MKAIVLHDLVRGIARNGVPPWTVSLHNELLKELTENKEVLLGRKAWCNWDSIPFTAAKYYIWTRNDEYAATSKYCHDTGRVIEPIQVRRESEIPENVIVLGGYTVFDTLFDQLDTIYTTRLFSRFNCGTKFPKYEDYEDSGFKLVDSDKFYSDGGVRYRFEKWAKDLNWTPPKRPLKRGLQQHFSSVSISGNPSLVTNASTDTLTISGGINITTSSSIHPIPAPIPTPTWMELGEDETVP